MADDYVVVVPDNNQIDDKPAEPEEQLKDVVEVLVNGEDDNQIEANNQALADIVQTLKEE